MDHKVSKDMISSGMIPSGEKTQADLGRTQYGSAPSPSKLMDAYKSMYDKKGETLDEGLMDAVKNVASKVSNSNIGNPRKPHIDNIKRAREKGFFKGIKDGEAQATAELRKAGDSETLKSDRRERVTQIMNKNNQEKNRTGSRSTGESIDLLAAYRSVYEHHKKDADGNTIPHEGEEVKEENINELKTRTMLNYIDKASDSASKELDKANKTTSRKKEVKARLKMDSRERGIEMAKDKIMKRVKEDADLFDVISDKLIEEGYSKKESYEIMANLTKEQLEEINEAVVSGTLATLGLIGTKLLGGAKVAAAAAGKGLTAGKALAAKGLGAAKTAATAGAKKITSAAQTGMSKASDALGKVSNIAKDKAQGMGDTMKNMGKSVGDDVKDEIKRKILQGNDGGSNKITKTGTMSAGSYQAASADLFDIVKGQLLDEGLSEEEIKDIMLTLTPDEILNELSGDLLRRATVAAGDKAAKLASQKDTAGAVNKLEQQKRLSSAMKSKNLEKSRAENMRKPTQYDRPLSRPTPDPNKPYPGTPR